MAGSPSDPESPLGRVLRRARDLAQEVRETAERVHNEAQESHRLTAVARRYSERGRQLSEAGREEARAVKRSISWSLDTANKAGRRLHPKTKADLLFSTKPPP
jgi:hypothetical protein